MKPKQIFGIIAAIAALIVIALMLPKKPAKPEGDELANVAKTAAPKPAAAGTAANSAGKPADSDIYFLNEEVASGAGSPSTKKTVVKRMPDATGSRRLTQTRALTDKSKDGDFISPKWSPDGLQLMFSRPGFEGLYMTSTMGGGVAQITSKENIGYNAKWGADGSIETKTNTGEKQKFNPDGSPVDSPSDSVDENQVGPYTKDDAVYYRANPGEAPVTIAQGEDRYYGGTISPDGKYIAYNGLSTGLYIAPLDGSAPPVSIGQGHSPSWLPDGSGVVYSVLEDDGHNVVAGDLYLATPDGSSISNLTQSPNAIENYPSVGPDSTIAFESDGVIQVGTLQ